MALVDISATFEDNVLKNGEIEDIISEDLRYRDKQLLRFKLSKYIKTNEEALKNAPFGLYACVSPRWLSVSPSAWGGS